MTDSFKRKLSDLISSESIDSTLNTPNYVLTDYIMSCLKAFNHAKANSYSNNYEYDKAIFTTTFMAK